MSVASIRAAQFPFPLLSSIPCLVAYFAWLRNLPHAEEETLATEPRFRDRNWQYRKASDTDIRDTFDRVRHQQARESERCVGNVPPKQARTGGADGGSADLPSAIDVEEERERPA